MTIEDTEPAEAKSITAGTELPVYEYIRDAQFQHGLKYDDYRQYRSYCSRRIHRIRRSLNVHQGVAPSAKARHQRGRKLLNINMAMVLEAGDYAERMLVIPLYLAERAWSYAMQLKQEANEYPRRRYHLVRRLYKAAQHASKFEDLCHDPESPCTERSKKEASAYAAYINGMYKMERQDHAGAREDLHKCLVLYTTLSLSAKDAFLEQYRLRVDELRASLRYCTFTLGEKPKEHKNKLPATLQFHDLAFKHAQQVQQQELKSTTAAASPKKSADKKIAETKVMTIKAKMMAAEQKQISPHGDDDDEDEFEEAIDDDQSEHNDMTDESDDNDNRQQSRGGVTNLVKGWLGGAWS